MRMRIREIREVKEDKNERNLPYYPKNEDKPKISFADAQAFWDNMFANEIEEEK